MNPDDPRPSKPFAGTARTEWEESRTTFQRVYDYVIGTREFATADEVAERVNCSTAGARDALENWSRWESQSAVIPVRQDTDGMPRTSAGNESEHSPEELRHTVDELVDAGQRLQEQYSVPAPDALSPEIFETTDHDTVEEHWDDVAEWRTIRRDIEVLQRAAHRAERKHDDASDAASA